jgi:hypothetical protein
MTMPVHDWTRVSDGIFHSFHLSWTDEIMAALNAGLLPSEYYALAEQVIGEFGPDVLALKFTGPDTEPTETTPRDETSVALAPPKVRFTAQTEMDQYVLKRRTIVVRHSSGDRVVALIEIVSPGNKGSRHSLRSFVEKAAAALYRGFHLLVLDVHPPTRRDPQGIHGAIWEEIADEPYCAPPDKPLTLVAYEAAIPKTAYIEPIAVGDLLPDMPLFLHQGIYISVPLEATYRAASGKVPQRWRSVLE